MSNTLMTPETAPRDAAALAGQGPFIHRRLGEALEGLGFKCWSNEREKTAFVTASPQDRAQMLLSQLQAFDAARGGAPAPQAAPQQAPAAPPPAPPAAAPAAPPATTGRAPRTQGGAAASNGAGVGNVVELLNAIKELGGKIDAATGALNTKAGANELEGLKAMVAASMQLQKVELGLLCLFGEQVLGAGMADFIGDSISYGHSAVEKISELTGKG